MKNLLSRPNFIPEVVSRTDAAGCRLVKSFTLFMSNSDFSQRLIHATTPFIHLASCQSMKLTLLKTARESFFFKLVAKRG